jgi:hypothetical protein
MKASSTSVTKVRRVLIADDHPVVREGLVTILKSEKDIEVVSELLMERKPACAALPSDRRTRPSARRRQSHGREPREDSVL